MNTWQETLLLVGALHSGLFAIFHLFFWRVFDWGRELGHLKPVNRGILQVLNLCLTFALGGLAVVVALNASEILATRLGSHLLILLSAFWAFRLILQFLFFTTRHWASWLLSFLFLGGASLYAFAAWGGTT